MKKKVKLYIQDHGHLENDLAFSVCLPRLGTVDNKRPRAEWISVPSLSLLINHPEAGWILFDTGPHTAMERVRSLQSKKIVPWYGKPQDNLEAKLKLLGLTPKDIDVLIISHFHLDHAAGIHLFKNTNCGKNIVVHKSQLEFASFLSHLGQGQEEMEYEKEAYFDIPGIGYKTVSKDTTIADGLELLSLEGHTPGILGLMIRLENTGWVIYPSDAIFMKQNFGPPPVPSGKMYDSLGFYRTIEKVAYLRERYNAWIIYPHDWTQYTTELKLSPEYYE